MTDTIQGVGDAGMNHVKRQRVSDADQVVNEWERCTPACFKTIGFTVRLNERSPIKEVTMEQIQLLRDPIRVRATGLMQTEENLPLLVFDPSCVDGYESHRFTARST